MIQAGQIRRGMAIKVEGTLYSVVEASFHRSAQRRAMKTCKLKNLSTGAVTERTFRTDERVEDIFVEKALMEYLYFDGKNYIFMDTNTYEQFSLSKDLLGEQGLFLQPNVTVEVAICEGRPVYLELPAFVELEVKETPVSIKGATATSQYKPALLETGLKISVPPFIEQGDIVRVDTRSGEYLERAK